MVVSHSAMLLTLQPDETSVIQGGKPVVVFKTTRFVPMASATRGVGGILGAIGFEGCGVNGLGSVLRGT